MAQDIDQQLNESVGIAASNAATTSYADSSKIGPDEQNHDPVLDAATSADDDNGWDEDDDGMDMMMLSEEKDSIPETEEQPPVSVQGNSADPVDESKQASLLTESEYEKEEPTLETEDALQKEEKQDVLVDETDNDTPDANAVPENSLAATSVTQEEATTGESHKQEMDREEDHEEQSLAFDDPISDNKPTTAKEIESEPNDPSIQHPETKQDETTVEEAISVDPERFSSEAVAPNPEDDVVLTYPTIDEYSERNQGSNEIMGATVNEGANNEMQLLVEQLQKTIHAREEQLLSKTQQLDQMQELLEQEKQSFNQKIQQTKEEAKRRIQKMKETLEKQNSINSSAEDKDSIIQALRQEGERLANRQMEMEQAVRQAKGETRDIREKYQQEQATLETTQVKLQSVEQELVSVKQELSVARKGETQAQKYEKELQKIKDTLEQKTSTILSMEQTIRELKAENKDLQSTIVDSRKGVLLESQEEHKRLSRLHQDELAALNDKLQTFEQHAATREEQLRQEVSELRQRWQDAVRRADTLSMDAQSSTGPLLRQLESMERQHRVRSTAWAELETKLRNELEDTILEKDKLLRDRTELKSKYSRLERTSKELKDELEATKSELESKIDRINQLEQEARKMVEEREKAREKYAEVERLANEGVSRVRSEMSQTVVDAEERHRSQLDSLQAEIRQEKERRVQLEKQVDELLENAGTLLPPSAAQSIMAQREEGTKPRKLKNSQNQAEILAGALGGLEDDSDSDSDTDAEEMLSNNRQANGGSFAALEELKSKLKISKVELSSLRKSLEESQQSRDRMVEELAEARSAKEKLPLFEQKVQELTEENELLTLEVRGLQEDIQEVKEMYRTQLNVLLEEKVSSPQNGIHQVDSDSEDNVHAESEISSEKPSRD